MGYLTLDPDVVKVSDTSIDSLNTNLFMGKSYYISGEDGDSVRFAIYYSLDSVYDSEDAEYDSACIPLESDLGDAEQELVKESTDELLKYYLGSDDIASETMRDALYETDMTTYSIDKYDLIVHSCIKPMLSFDDDKMSLVSFYLANREYQIVILDGDINDLDAVFKSMHFNSDFDKDYKEAKKELKKSTNWAEFMEKSTDEIGGSSSQSTEITSATTKPVETTASVVTTTQVTTEPAGVQPVASEGAYKVGIDVPAGDYIFYSDKYMGSSNSRWDYGGDIELRSSTASDADILEYTSVGTWAFMHLTDGQYIKISGCSMYPADYTEKIDKTFEGMYRVGIDIPAGEYKVSPDEDAIYATLSVYSSNDPVNRDTLDFQSVESSAYVTVQDGNYLFLEDCHIEQ